jgi:hypothetical protein
MQMIGRMWAAALFAALVFGSGPAGAEGGESLAERTGKWTFTMNEPGADAKNLGAARLKALRSNLQEIVRLITSSPVLTPPKGFEARFWGSASIRDRYDICSGKKCPPPRPNGVLAMMIGSYGESNGTVKAAFNRPATMDISVNNLGHIFAHLPVLARDGEGFFLPEPERDGERQGIPAYLNNGHAIAVLSRGSDPLWLPVSNERYLRAVIATLDKALHPPVKTVKKGKRNVPQQEVTGKHILREETRTWIDPATEKEWVESSRTISWDDGATAEALGDRLKKFQESLDALTPEQRQQQARIEQTSAPEGEAPSLLPPDSSGGVGVVTPNFAYFKRSLPAEAVQLVTLQWKFDGAPVFDPDKAGISESLHNGRLLEIYRTVEWGKLANKLQLR